ncbi:MAG: lactonase family protein, partial [Chitinophagaceae bacterium]
KPAMRLTFLILLLTSAMGTFAQERFLFIGTYTGTGSKGIYVYKFNYNTGKAEQVSVTGEIENPSYLAVSSNGRFVYAVTESAGKTNSAVSAFSFDRKAGKLSLINTELTGGDNPCYVAVTKKNNYVFTANYSGGSLTAFPVKPDGSLAPRSQLIQHEGKGTNPSRQEKPHVHSTIFSPKEDVLFSPDLGLDKVFAYSFNASAPQPLQPASVPFTETKPGSGPRHIDFHPTKPYVYLIEELSGNVVAYKYNKSKLTSIQEIAAHPEEYKGTIGSADIHVSPDGKFLYASNRAAENTMAIFAIDQTTGRLTSKGFTSTLGKAPRNFVIDPSGKFLLVANQDSGNIVIFKRDLRTGLLEKTGDEINIPKPVCLKFLD